MLLILIETGKNRKVKSLDALFIIYLRINMLIVLTFDERQNKCIERIYIP